jgi:hypothetical protein
VGAWPFLTVLAPSERSHQERGTPHKQLTDWARQMITQAQQWLPERLRVVVADRSSAALELLAAGQGVPQPVNLVTRLRLDAALSDPAPPPTGQRGRPRKMGARQPTPAARLSDPATNWQDTTVRWYAGTARTVRLASATAVWYHSGLPPVAIRWVLITDPDGKFEPQALLSTNLEATPTEIVEWFVPRWQLEVTFEEARAHLGIETSASGRMWRFCAPRPCCWGCSRRCVCSPISCSKAGRCRCARRPGMPRRYQPSATPWPLSASTSGRPRFLGCRPRKPTWSKFRRHGSLA